MLTVLAHRARIKIKRLGSSVVESAIRRASLQAAEPKHDRHDRRLALCFSLRVVAVGTHAGANCMPADRNREGRSRRALRCAHAPALAPHRACSRHAHARSEKAEGWRADPSAIYAPVGTLTAATLLPSSHLAAEIGAGMLSVRGSRSPEYGAAASGNWSATSCSTVAEFDGEGAGHCSIREAGVASAPR